MTQISNSLMTKDHADFAEGGVFGVDLLQGNQLDQIYRFDNGLGFMAEMATLEENVVHERVEKLQELMLQDPNFMEGIPPHLNHHAKDIYLRELFAPKGHIIIGAKHSTEHFNVCLSGSAIVLMGGKPVTVVAPCIIKTGAGVKKCAYVLDNMRWLNVHYNPTQETDEFKLQELFMPDEPPYKVHQKAMDENIKRMSLQEGD